MLYKVSKPTRRAYYDDSHRLTEGDQILVIASNPIRVRDQSNYPESRQPSYTIQASSIQISRAAASAGSSQRGRWFLATVVSDTGEYLLVKPHPNAPEAAQGALISVSLSDVAHPMQLKLGDRLTIHYDGQLVNGDPATILGAYQIVYDWHAFSHSVGITSVHYDIDGDGEEELIGLGYGPTSGIFTFTVTVWDEGGVEYANIFCYDHGKLSFTEENGKLQIRWNDYQGNNEARFLDIEIVGIYIFLYDNSNPLRQEQHVVYWGN